MSCLPGRRRRPSRKPWKRQNHLIGGQLVLAAAGACASSRRSNAGCSRARRPTLPQLPGRRRDPARPTLTSRRNVLGSGDRHLRALRQDQGKRPEPRRRPTLNPAAAWSNVSLAASLSAPSPTPRRHHRARPKLEIPIDPRRTPAGSCLGGFRTPAHAQTRDPRRPASGNLHHCGCSRPVRRFP